MTRADAALALAAVLGALAVLIVTAATAAIAREIRGIAADAKARQEAADRAVHEFKEKQR